MQHMLFPIRPVPKCLSRWDGKIHCSATLSGEKMYVRSTLNALSISTTSSGQSQGNMYQMNGVMEGLGAGHWRRSPAVRLR